MLRVYATTEAKSNKTLNAWLSHWVSLLVSFKNFFFVGLIRISDASTEQ